MKKLIASVFISYLLALGHVFAQNSLQSSTDKLNLKEVQKKLNKTKIPWVSNSGQQNEQVAYYANTFAGTVFLTKEGDLVYNLPKEKGKANVVKEIFTGTKPKNITATNKAVAKINHFIKKGDSYTEHHNESFYTVSLGEIWDGIEVKLNAYGSNIEKLFFVEPHTNYKNIKVEIPDAKKLEIKPSGELHIETSSGEIAFSTPIAYQMINGTKVEVEVSYAVSEDSYSFEVGEYDADYLLVIDPLIASTYLGSNHLDYIVSIATDSENNIFVLTSFYRNPTGYPITEGAYVETDIHGDIVTGGMGISKFSSDLSTLKSSTSFPNGSVKDLVIDNNDNIYILTVGSFIKTPGTYNYDHLSRSNNYFLLKMSNDLSKIICSAQMPWGILTYDVLSYSKKSRIKVLSNNEILIAGTTFESGDKYPKTEDAYTTNPTDNYNIFVSKFSNDLSTLLASSVFGSDNIEFLSDIEVGSNDSIILTGMTEDYSTFPYKNLIHKSDGRWGIFIYKLSPSLSSLHHSAIVDVSSHFQKSAVDVKNVTIDSHGDIFISGYTNNTTYPITDHAYQKNVSNPQKGVGFITKISSDLSKIKASTLFGGDFSDRPNNLFINEESVFLTGGTVIESNGQNEYPQFTDNSYEPNLSENYIAKFSSDLSTLENVSYFGQKGIINTLSENPVSIVGRENNIIIAFNNSNQALPVKENSYQKMITGMQDIGIFKITNNLAKDFPIILSISKIPYTCQDSDLTLSFSIDSYRSIKYQIDKGSGFEDLSDDATYQGTTTNTITIKNTTADMDGHLIRCIAANGVSETISDPVRLNIATSNLSITQQPTDISTCEGATASFTAGADSESAQYAWYKDGSALGQTSKTLELKDLSLTDAGTYSCKITNACGVELTSNSAILTVQKLRFTQKPQTQTVCYGSSADFSVTAEGENLSFQWKKDGTDINGATGTSLSLSSLDSQDIGAYTCVITSTCGTRESTAAQLSLDTPLSLTAHPQGAQICSGTQITFSGAVDGPNPAYQWQLGGVNIAGANSAGYTLNSAGVSNTGDYKLTATNSCGSVSSNVANLSLIPFAITEHPKTGDVCQKTDHTLTVGTEGENLTFQWKKNGTDINGATFSSLTLSNVSPHDDAGYICSVKGQCGELTSNTATITTLYEPIITVQLQDLIRCERTQAILSLTATGSNLQYQWQKDGTDHSTTSADLSIASAATSDAGIYKCKVWNTCKTLESAPITLTVNPNPNITAIEGEANVCLNTEGLVYSATDNENYNYGWSVQNGSFAQGSKNSIINTNWTQNSGTGTVRIIVTDKTTQCQTQLSKTVNIDGNIPPKPNILTKGDALIICRDSGMHAYKWYFNQKLISGEARQFMEIPNGQTGTYNIEIFYENGCGTMSDPLTINGKKTIPLDATVKLSPNPTSERVTFSIDNDYRGSILYSIHNQSGTPMQSGEMKKTGQYLEHITNIRTGAPGNYIVLFLFEKEGKVSKQLIVK